MSLFKQLLIGFALLFALLMSSVFVSQYYSARDFIESQQQINMRNLNNAVKLAILPYIKSNDNDSIISVAKSLYDEGFHGYIKIQYQGETQPLIEHLNTTITSPPAWFKALTYAQPIVITQLVEVDGRPPVIIQVANNTDNADLSLWKAARALFFNFSLFMVLSALLLILMIKHILTPMKKLQMQADQISQQYFGDLLPLPKLKELKELTESFNHMSVQIEKNHRQQAKEVEKLRLRVYQDPISGLANLDYLNSSVFSAVNDKNVYSWILLCSDYIKHYVDNNEINTAQELTKKLGTQLKTLANDSNIIASINLYEFIIVQPHLSREDLTFSAKKILRTAEQAYIAALDLDQPPTRIGIVEEGIDNHFDDILQKARIAVQENMTYQGDYINFYTDGKHTNVKLRTRNEWREFVKQAVTNMEIKLSTQDALDQDGQLLHQEIFSRIEQNGLTISASQFINSIQYHVEGLMFDMHIIDLALRQYLHANTERPIAINITVNSITSSNFSRWLDTKLANYPHLSHLLMFELPEIAFMRYHNDTQRLTQIIQKHQFQFGIDNFGRHFGQVYYLNVFMPSYVKLDHPYTIGLEDYHKADLLHSILRVANSLNILTIATRIETQEQLDATLAFPLDGFQGIITNKEKQA